MKAKHVQPRGAAQKASRIGSKATSSAGDERPQHERVALYLGSTESDKLKAMRGGSGVRGPSVL